MDFLLKAGRPDLIGDMFKNEYLYFNTLSRFRAKEKDPTGRDDPREGNIKTTQGRFLEITDPKTRKKYKLHEMFKEFNCQYNEHPTELPNNLCSLYTLTFDENMQYEKIDDRILALGDKTILIYKIGRFFEVLDKALEDHGLEYSRKPVTYYDYKTYDGTLTFHHKDSFFQFQKEYRIILWTDGKKALKIPLPGLKEIATLVDTRELNTVQLRWFDQNNLQHGV